MDLRDDTFRFKRSSLEGVFEKDKIKYSILWSYSYLNFKTRIHITLTFPDGDTVKKSCEHSCHTDHDHYETISFWVDVLIAEWRNKPYALAEPTNVQDVHDDRVPPQEAPGEAGGQSIPDRKSREGDHSQG